ncbi:MAG: hypothetical protein JXA92_05465 [candidate division Zixibacteria bacterium]|nr:hypothetical protein [candidate division Zixibacteria bacterium]
MKRLALILFLVILAAGCGEYDPRKPVYNTTDNPDNYPPIAINLLDGIENGTLVGYDTIILTFADLYTEHGELLDNNKWSEIVKRLGLKFKYYADSLVPQGIDKFYPAAEWYALAVFARPDDENLTRDGDLFGIWKKAVDDGTIAANFNVPGYKAEFTEQLDLLRYFLFNDSLYSEFGREHLMPTLLGQYSMENPIESSITDKLSLPDKAFLTYLGYYDKPIEEKFIYYTEPEINLVTGTIRPLGEDWFRIELYFLPRDTVTVDYTIALRGNIAGDVPNLGNQGRNIIPFDFAPEIPSSDWTFGKIAVAFHKFYYPGVKGRFSVGLYEKGTNPLKYNPVWKSNYNFYTLPDSVLKVY